MGAAAIVVIVVLLLGVGWYGTYVQPYRATVLTVGKRSVTMDYFIKRLKGVLPQFSSSDVQTVVSVVPLATRDQIEQELILLQRAPQLGVNVSNQEIDAEMAKSLGVPTSPDGQPTDRNAYEAALRAKLEGTGLSLSQYRQQIEAQLLKTKVQDKLSADLPKTAPEVKYSEVLMNTEADAKALLDRLNKGDTWEAIQADVRKDPTKGSVAEFDFQPKQQIDEKLAAQLFNLKPVEHTDVVQTADGKYTIARLIEKDDTHTFSDDQRKAVAPKLYSNWQDEQKKMLTIKDGLTDDRKLFAIQHSNYKPAAQSQQQVPRAPQLPPGLATPPGGLVPPVNPAPAVSPPTGAAPATGAPAAPAVPGASASP
ncbi:MAG: SurA N-terminal domain-containing protein [Dehalococcoidia bacterium]